MMDKREWKRYIKWKQKVWKKKLASETKTKPCVLKTNCSWGKTKKKIEIKTEKNYYTRKLSLCWFVGSPMQTFKKVKAPLRFGSTHFLSALYHHLHTQSNGRQKVITPRNSKHGRTKGRKFGQRVHET